MREFNKMFCIGLTKTGTNSVTEALNILDVPIRHYPDSDETFNRISQGIFEIPELETHRGISDVMAAAFYQEFYQEYPGSLFILTVRFPEEEWVESARRKMKGVPKGHPSRHAEPQQGKERSLSNFLRVATYGTAVWDKDRFLNVYDRHLHDVMRFFNDKPGELLIMDVCSGIGGWPQLCTFLEVDEPDVEFPHLAKSSAKQKRESDEAKRTIHTQS